MKLEEDSFCNLTNPRNFTSLRYFLASTGVIPSFEMEPANSRYNTLKKIRFVLIIGVILACILTYASLRLAMVQPGFALQTFILLVTPGSIALLVVYATLSINLCNNRKYRRLTSLFDQLDDIVYKHVNQVIVPHRRTLVKMVFWKTAFPLTFCITHIIYTDILVTWWFCMETFMRHLVTFRVVLLQHHIQQIGYRYEVIEKILSFKIGKYLEGLLRDTEVSIALQDMAKILGILSEIVRLFNEIFGWILFMMTISVILSILYYINNAILFFKMLDLKWVTIFVFWSCFHLCLVLLLASASARTSKNARRTGKICFDLIISLKMSSDESIIESKRSIEELLLLIASEIYIKPPVFSVQGFFVLDFKWLFFIVNFTTTYVVVLFYYAGSNVTYR